MFLNTKSQSYLYSKIFVHKWHQSLSTNESLTFAASKMSHSSFNVSVKKNIFSIPQLKYLFLYIALNFNIQTFMIKSFFLSEKKAS